MPSTDPFAILGVEEKGATLASIKKAYSVKLKVTRPDDDPEGFMELREAYNHAKNIVKWNSQTTIDDGLNEDLSEDIEAPKVEVKPEQIKYWYDEKLDFNFNSSPSGQLIEKTVRWMLERKGAEPDQFFDELMLEPAFQNKPDFMVFSNFYREHIFYSAGGGDHDYYEEENFLEDVEYERPEWLSDEAILRIDMLFDFQTAMPKNEWEARQLNCIKKIFEPVLLANSVIEQKSDPHDVLAFRAKEQEQLRKDSHGSYFDRSKKKWIDKSPVTEAMNDINELIEIPWSNASDTTWRDILERDNLQMLDEFQDLDARLRNFICNKTGMYEDTRKLKLPPWLSKSVVLLLDDTFGWNYQSGRHEWEYEQYRWLHSVIAQHRDKPKTQNVYKTWQYINRNSYEFLGYQPMPWLLKPSSMLYTYCGYRLLQAILRVL
ncbi:J domain-containing protein [Amylibacter sp. SFDW26]|uniref:J domain-containing protein n=1 Tax=Amylibacter sp. SFDW26 TaxID=2652722 RepID=UPI00126165FF|nr:J domain-containing protein [Amylibacter sp. SFDW26]KAB7615216.1 J domain-containing protein [Amylibacter sp. SFDW26]